MFVRHVNPEKTNLPAPLPMRNLKQRRQRPLKRIVKHDVRPLHNTPDEIRHAGQRDVPNNVEKTAGA